MMRSQHPKTRRVRFNTDDADDEDDGVESPTPRPRFQKEHRYIHHGSHGALKRKPQTADEDEIVQTMTTETFDTGEVDQNPSRTVSQTELTLRRKYPPARLALAPPTAEQLRKAKMDQNEGMDEDDIPLAHFVGSKVSDFPHFSLDI